MATTADKKPKEPKHVASFISELVTDPSDVPDVQKISGYLGASAEEGYSRLYLTPDLSYFLDIKSDDILLEQPVPQAADPLGAVNLWIKRDADMKPSASKGATQVSQQTLPTWPTVPTWPTPAGQGAAPQGTFTPIPCGGGGGGLTFTPVTVPQSITPICQVVTKPPICPPLTWPTFPTIHTLPTIPTLPTPQTIHTFPTPPTIHTFPTTTPVAGGVGQQAAAPQGTLTPVNCTINPICFAGQEGGGGQAAQGTFTPIPCGGGGGGLTFTPVTLPQSLTPICQIVTQAPICPPHTVPPTCQIFTQAPFCPPLTWPTIPHTFPTPPTIHTFPTTTPVAGGVGQQAAAPQGTFTPVNCTITPICFAGQEGGGGQAAQGTFTPIPCGGGGGGGLTITPATLPQSLTPICPIVTHAPICPPHSFTPICQIVTQSPICPPLTWPTIPHTPPTIPTFPTTTPVAGGVGQQAAAPQGTFTPVNCTINPICFTMQEGGGGQAAQGTFTPIPCGGGGGGGLTITPVTLPHSLTPICPIVTHAPICPPHSFTPICQIVTQSPICPPLTWPTIPHTPPTIPTFPTTTPVAGGVGQQAAAPQGTLTPVNCTFFPVC